MTSSDSKSFSRTTTGKEVVEAFAKEVEGKTIIVTGASKGGLGEQTCLALAHGHPKRLILAGRTEPKIAPVVEEVKKISPSTAAHFVKLDLNDLSSVRKTAAEINGMIEKIDILINNAGVMATETYTKTADGIEHQFGANHIGPFLLTNLLMDKIGDGARIVNVTSMGYEAAGIRFDDWNFSDGKTYDPWYGYSQSKTANILFAKSLAQKLEKRGAQAYVVHPGLILSSNLMSNVSQETFAQGVQMWHDANPGKSMEMEEQKTLEQGCSTTLVAALDPSLKGDSGAFLRDAQIYREQIKEHATDPENARKLWALSEEIVGQKFEI